MKLSVFVVFFFQAEDGIRDLVRSRGLGDVYKRQLINSNNLVLLLLEVIFNLLDEVSSIPVASACDYLCLLYTSDAADERSSVDLGGRRIIKKKTTTYLRLSHTVSYQRHMVVH